MAFKFFNIIVLLGSIQGFILSVLLFTSQRNNRYANRLLAMLILLIAMPCLNLYLQESGLAGKYRTIMWVVGIFPFVVAMPFGPLIYFYTRSVIDPSFRLARKQSIHFLPVVIDLIPYVIVWYFLIGIQSGLLARSSGAGWGNIIDEINAYSDIPRWLSITLYVGLARRYLANVMKSSSALSLQADYRWLKLFLNVFLGFQLLWFLFLVPYIIPQIRYSLLDAIGWYPVYVPLVIIIYWLGMKGYFQTLSHPKKSGAGADIPTEVIERTRYLLVQSMEADKYYLNPTLSLVSLSRHIQIPQKTVSLVLNQYLNKSFNDFVNEYRVEEVKRRLMESGHRHLTIAGIALESGFNSQATFQRVFKQLARVSPSEFLARHVTSSDPAEKTSV